MASALSQSRNASPRRKPLLNTSVSSQKCITRNYNPLLCLLWTAFCARTKELALTLATRFIQMNSTLLLIGQPGLPFSSKSGCIRLIPAFTISALSFRCRCGERDLSLGLLTSSFPFTSIVPSLEERAEGEATRCSVREWSMEKEEEVGKGARG